MKQLLGALFDRAGYTVVPNWRLEHYPAAVFLGKMLRLLEIDCVLDVGANTGQYHDFLRDQVGYRGKIVSFEPIPAHVELLRARAASDHDWLIEGYALGSTPGHAEFNVMASTQFSSFLKPDNSKVQMFETLNETRQRVQVQVRRLDDVLPGLEERIQVKSLYLKLDTQGFDLEVIKGAGAHLAKISALQTEASVVPIYDGAPGYATTIATLGDLGFDVSGIFPNNPSHFPRLIEFDCYMIRRSLL
jgi:FkbM family methyltransferase